MFGHEGKNSLKQFGLFFRSSVVLAPQYEVYRVGPEAEHEEDDGVILDGEGGLLHPPQVGRGEGGALNPRLQGGQAAVHPGQLTPCLKY